MKILKEGYYYYFDEIPTVDCPHCKGVLHRDIFDNEYIKVSVSVYKVRDKFILQWKTSDWLKYHDVYNEEVDSIEEARRKIEEEIKYYAM